MINKTWVEQMAEKLLWIKIKTTEKPIVCKTKQLIIIKKKSVHQRQTLTELFWEGDNQWRCSGTNYSISRPPLVMLMQFFPPYMYTRLTTLTEKGMQKRIL